jgi:hypothetical protein
MKPFAYVLIAERRGDLEPQISLYQTLEAAEAALRAYAANLYVGLGDDEIVETLSADEHCAHIYAVRSKRGGQASVEVQPFARKHNRMTAV